MLANQLLLHRIEMVPDIRFNKTETFIKGQVYSISLTGLVVPMKWLQETMLKQFIHQSLLLIAVAFQFSKTAVLDINFNKTDRNINNNIWRHYYSLYWIKALFVILHKSPILVRLDAYKAYVLFWVTEWNDQKFAIYITYGLFIITSIWLE